MKKLLILLTITLVFIGCNSTPKITYEKDVFKPENSRYQTDWVGYPLDVDFVEFRLIKRSNDKIYIQGRYTLARSFYVKNTDTLSLKFTDGTTINLNYNGVLSKSLYSDYSYFDITTKTKEINNLGTLEYIRAESSLGYNNSEKIEKEKADKLNTLLARLKNNEYDKEN